MRPSFEASMEFYRSFSNPRRKRVKVMNDFGVMEWVYRKVALSEEDRGEPYPLCVADAASFSDFGIGIGIYYVQLVLYSILFLICGFILLPSMRLYTNKYEHSGLTNSTLMDSLLVASATCEPGRVVTATEGCTNNETSCLAIYRDNTTHCELYASTVMYDLIMCAVFVVGVFVIAAIEGYCIEELDESVQTAQDYAVVVEDPPEDAADPQQWFEFFGRFGTVRYVTVTRKNDEVTAALLAKYELISSFMTFYTKLSCVFEEHCERCAEGGELGGPVHTVQNSFKHAVEAQNLGVNEAFVRSALNTLASCAADVFPVGGRPTRTHRTAGAEAATGGSAIGGDTASAGADGASPAPKRRSAAGQVGTLSGDAAALIAEVERVGSRLQELDEELRRLAQHAYPVCRVYVVFAQEHSKRVCLQSLEVPDLVSSGLMADSSGSTRALFRGEVLEVLEPPEPNNILWRNLEVTDLQRRFRQFCSVCLTTGVLTACYFILSVIPLKDSTAIGIVVGIIDTILPLLLPVFTEFELALDQDDLQDSLLSKLFIARILTSTVFSYMALSWGNFLDGDVLASVLSIQISASFTAPIINFMDLPGLLNRHVLSRCFPAADQMESNQTYFKGAVWMLAERYTSLGKIIFISLVYALITPSGMFIAAAACILTFFLDRFMLLRRWAPAPMLDACLAARFRQQVMFAVSVHMYISLIFISGWPFDSANLTSPEGVSPETYRKVDKYPSLWVLNMDKEGYMAPGTQEMFQPYKVCTYIVLLLTAYLMVGHRIVTAFRQAFFSNDDSVGDATRIPYTVVEGIDTYCPIVSLTSSVRQADHTLIAADIEGANHAHIKPLLHALQMRGFLASQGVSSAIGPGVGHIARGGDVPVNLFNLSLLLPRNCWHNCLGIVKYYRRDDDTDDDTSEKEKEKEAVKGDKKKGGKRRERGDALSRLAFAKPMVDPAEALTMEIELGDLELGSDEPPARGSNGRLVVKSGGVAAPSNVLLQLARTATNAPGAGGGYRRGMSLRDKINAIQPEPADLPGRPRNGRTEDIRDFDSFRDWIEATAPAVSSSIGPVMLRNCYEELTNKIRRADGGAGGKGVGRSNVVSAATSGGISGDQYMAMLRVLASLRK